MSVYFVSLAENLQIFIFITQSDPSLCRVVINDVDNLDYFCWLASFWYGYNTCIFTYTKYAGKSLARYVMCKGGNFPVFLALISQ